MKINLPIYNDAGRRELSRLLPFLEPSDTLMLVSGNVDKPLDIGWLENTLASLQNSAPQPVLLATAGLEHLTTLAGANLPVSGLVYIYEPDFPNVPEFTWEAAETLANVERARATTGGVPFGFKPTGRPLYQRSLEAHGWNYGEFAERADLLLVQTQTYCKNGTFAEAVQKLGVQCEAAQDRTLAQVTLDLNARNGVNAAEGFACARAVSSSGLAGVTAWWSPRFADNAARFIELLRQRA